MLKKSYNLNTVLWIAISLVTVSCSEDIVEDIKESFVGEWNTTKVTDHQGSLSLDWVGVKLVFEQKTDSSGTYEMVNTLYDSVWFPSGNWTLMNDSKDILINGTAFLNINVVANSMTISKQMPWARRADCDISEAPCTLGISDTWYFEFERE